MSQKEDIFLWHACQSKNLFALKTFGIRPYFQVLLVSGSRVFARKFRPVDFFEVTNFDPDVRRCMRCMRFLLLPYESHRKFMEIHGNYQRYIYSLGMPSPNRRRRATLFLGVAVLCAPALVFAYAGWTIRRWAEWGIWRLVTCDMVHQFLWTSLFLGIGDTRICTVHVG